MNGEQARLLQDRRTGSRASGFISLPLLGLGV